MEGITKGSAGEGSEKTDLLEVVIPDGVTIIEQDALLRYTKLRRLILPASLNQIAPQALSLCATLDKIITSRISPFPSLPNPSENGGGSIEIS